MNSQQSSLENRHAAFNTAAEIIFGLVRSATRCTPIKRHKIIKGYASEVYDVSTEEGSSFIVKIRYFGPLSYKQEQWAMEKCHMSGVPVPRVFELGSVELNGIKHEYTVLEKIPGQPFAEARPSLFPIQIDEVLVNAGRVLRKIHAVKADGFYQRAEDGIWDFPDWQSLMKSVVLDRSNEKDLILEAGFTNAEFEKMVASLKHYPDQFDCIQPVLNHGDYLPEHIYIDSNRGHYRHPGFRPV